MIPIIITTLLTQNTILCGKNSNMNGKLQINLQIICNHHLFKHYLLIQLIIVFLTAEVKLSIHLKSENI